MKKSKVGTFLDGFNVVFYPPPPQMALFSRKKISIYFVSLVFFSEIFLCQQCFFWNFLKFFKKLCDTVLSFLVKKFQFVLCQQCHEIFWPKMTKTVSQMILKNFKKNTVDTKKFQKKHKWHKINRKCFFKKSAIWRGG